MPRRRPNNNEEKRRRRVDGKNDGFSTEIAKHASGIWSPGLDPVDLPSDGYMVDTHRLSCLETKRPASPRARRSLCFGSQVKDQLLASVEVDAGALVQCDTGVDVAGVSILFGAAAEPFVGLNGPSHGVRRAASRDSIFSGRLRRTPTGCRKAEPGDARYRDRRRYPRRRGNRDTRCRTPPCWSRRTRIRSGSTRWPHRSRRDGMSVGSGIGVPGVEAHTPPWWRAHTSCICSACPHCADSVRPRRFGRG